MLRYSDLVRKCLPDIHELLPWELVVRIDANPELMILDVREPYEFAALHIHGSINVPRGVLETACEWDYEETVPELVMARKKEIVVVCRSGHRSALAVYNMQLMGYEHAISLKAGLRGWNDYEEPLWSSEGVIVDPAEVDEYFISKLRSEQRAPKH